MSRDTIANVIGRINKLRELSKNNTNEHEAAAAAAAAAKLIDRHQLSEMDLEVKGEKTSEPIEEIGKPLFKTGRVMLWVDRLAAVLCEHYGCTGYFKHVYDAVGVFEKNPNARRDSYKAFTIVGRKSDAEVVQYMFDWLQPVIIELMKNNAYGKGMKYSQNYAIGVVQGIKRQLDLEHANTVAEAAKANQSQAMVLLDNRHALSKQHLESTVKGLRARQVSLRGDSEARERGIRAGESIQLKKGIGTSAGPLKLK